MATTRSKGKMADDKDKMTVVLSCKPLTFDSTGGGGGGGETKQLRKIEKNKEKAAVTVSKAVIELELVSEQMNKTDEDNLSARTTPYERLSSQSSQEEVKTIQKESIKKLIGNGTTVKAGKKHTWITHNVDTTTSLLTVQTSDDISSPLKSSQKSADVGVGDDSSTGEGGSKPEAEAEVEAGTEQEAKGKPAEEVIEPEPETSGQPEQVIETEAKDKPVVEAATENNGAIESGSNGKPEVEKATVTEATSTPIIHETLDLNGNVPRYRYQLNPNAFDHNPVMKARILKSMYDRDRRVMNSKRKNAQLETENKKLKQTPLMTASSSKNLLQLLTFSSLPNQNQSFSTTQCHIGPIVCTGFPFIRLPSVYRPTPIFQINNISQSPREMPSSDNLVSELISPSTVPSPASAPKPKRRRASSQRQLRRQPNRGSKKALMVEKEKALIENLYKKFAEEDKEEDLEVIVAEIQRRNENKISLATTSTSATAGSQSQPINNNDDDNEAPIVQEVLAPEGKVQLQDSRLDKKIF